MATQHKVASWYWIVSAALTPFVMLAMVLAGWGFYKSKSYRAEAEQIAANLEEDHKRFEPLRAQIKEVAEVTGAFIKADPDQFAGSIAGSVRARPGVPEEDQKGQDANPVYRRWRSAEETYFGKDEKTPGMIAQYMSARQFLEKLNVNVSRWVAYKSYQIYTVKTINLYTPPAEGTPSTERPSGERPGTPTGQPGKAVVAAGVLERKGQKRVISAELPKEGVYLPQEGDIDAAYTKYQNKELPLDPAMRPRESVTMESILRQQMLLIDDLVSADIRQYGILVGEVSGDDNQVGVGAYAELQRKNKLVAELGAEREDVKNRGNEANAAIENTTQADTELENLAGELQRRFEDNFNILIGKITIEAQKFEAEKQMHEADRKAFVDNLKKIARFKTEFPVKRAEADGHITYSDDARKSIHIDLGRMDGVRAGQRFEVWRYSGKDKDLMLGVIEIVRTLSDYTSLCTVLDLADEKLPIRKGDAIVSRIWHAGRFLSVALHGEFEPPQQSYTKQRLSELLKQAGVRVVEKVQPGTDLVITGSNLFSDVWFRDARNDLRFESIKEEEVRLYIDPR